jgi:hypothetical protein
MKCINCGVKQNKPGFFQCSDCLAMGAFLQELKPPSPWLVLLAYALYPIHRLIRFYCIAREGSQMKSRADKAKISAIRNSDGTTSFYDRNGHFTGSRSNTTQPRADTGTIPGRLVHD